MTSDSIVNALQTYWTEMDKCALHDCYLALLHLVVIFPDICGALESEDGEAEASRYQDWCARYLPREPTPQERWAIRCALLHQGRTRAAKGRYTTYSFVRPPNHVVLHHVVVSDAAGSNCTLDIGELAKEIRRGVESWATDLQTHKYSNKRRNVATNLGTVLRMGMKDMRPAINLTTGTWSSTSTQ